MVVGAVSSRETLETLSHVGRISEECDVVELRLDSISGAGEGLQGLIGGLGVPILITARHPHEGGEGNFSAEARGQLLTSHLAVAALVDVELRSALELEAVIRQAQGKKLGVIGSFHDFNGTPSTEVLQGAIDMAVQFRFDAVKIATRLQSPADLVRLLALVGSEKRLPMSIMGMGPLGRASRVVLAKCGSVLNYGYLGNSNAPGQWPARRLKELLSEL